MSQRERTSAIANDRIVTDPRWDALLTCFEYFNADDDAVLGAPHQTSRTALVADLLIRPPR